MDITKRTAGRGCASDSARANVFVRGVLHVLSPAERHRVADTIAPCVGDRGPSPPRRRPISRAGLLAYLEHLGADPEGDSAAGHQGHRDAAHRPHHFGAPESVDTFPRGRWEVLTVAPSTTILTVPTQGDVPSPETIPGYLAVLPAGHSAYRRAQRPPVGTVAREPLQ